MALLSSFNVLGWGSTPMENVLWSGDALTAYATLLAAVVGGVSVWYINKHVEERKEASERQQQVLKALEFLVGGTQKRSAGIGILEGFFLGSDINESTGAKGSENRRKKPSAELGLREVFLPVIRNQLIYLRTSNDQKAEIHEHDNFGRLLRIWETMKPNETEIASLKMAIECHQALADGEKQGLEFFQGYAAFKEQLDESVGLVKPKT